MDNNKISIKDIAKFSGYSVSTVSRVLNHTGRFTEATRKKIIKIANQHHYRQNVIAQGMRSGSLSIIGVLVPDITNSYYASIVKKCEQYFFQYGYLTIVCNTNRDPALEQKYIAQLGNHFVDGLIIISTQLTLDNKNLNTFIPTVFIDRFPKSTRNSVLISSDNYTGAVLATQHLLDNNVYPVMVTTKDNNFSSNQKRLRGFKDTARKSGIVSPQIITLSNNSDNLENATKNLRQLLNNIIKKHERSGIFAVNDNLGVYIYQIAMKLNIKVPDTLRIIGFDDSTHAKEAQLSTIKQDINKLALLSCQNLISLLKKELISNRKIIIPVSLIKRQTT
ncbi:MAG: LacI family DNA-binding transcriptional regulator [Lactobacillus sp.]